MIDFDNMPQPVYSEEWNAWCAQQIEDFGPEQWMIQWNQYRTP